MQDITWIILAVLTIGYVVVISFVIPLLKSKQTASEWAGTVEQMKIIAGWVETAVKAAEILFKGTGLGSEKNKYVLEFVQRLCERNNITFDVDEVSAKIEEIGQNLNLWGVEK